VDRGNEAAHYIQGNLPEGRLGLVVTDGWVPVLERIDKYCKSIPGSEKLEHGFVFVLQTSKTGNLQLKILLDLYSSYQR